MTLHPPKPRASLSIGVVGHRPNRLPESALAEVAADIAIVLDALVKAGNAIRDAHAGVFSVEPPLYSVVTALAEGADRMAADEALARGFAMDAPLPFSIDDYEADFESAPSRAHYRALLAKARSVLELPGDRAQRTRAYERVGATVLGLSDIVLAVWDGGPAAGAGGTSSMVMAAVRAGVPLIHVDATGQRRPRIIWGGFSDMSLAPETFDGVPHRELAEGVPGLVEELIRPPSDPDERARLHRFFDERQHGVNLRIEWPALLAVTLVRPMGRGDLIPQTVEDASHRFADQAGGTRKESRLYEAYGWASTIGGRFAQIFRSAYVANFLLAALAVCAAAASLLFEHKTPFIIAEIAFISLVGINTMVGQRQDWHRRWIETREIAERIRVAVCLYALGLRPAEFHGEEPSWTGWYARALMREKGMRGGHLSDKELEAARATLLALLDDQCHYNDTTAKRMTSLEKRLEYFGLTLFLATALFAADHLIHEKIMTMLIPDDGLAGLVDTVLCAMLPALATATYGIRVIGDLGGIAERAERTHEALEALRKAVVADPLELEFLRARARTAAETLLGDVAGWRLAAESRGLAIPG